MNSTTPVIISAREPVTACLDCSGKSRPSKMPIARQQARGYIQQETDYKQSAEKTGKEVDERHLFSGTS